MCGICGYVNFSGEPVSQKAVEGMTSALAHRGPDDAGVYIQQSTGGHPAAVGLGHRRLSVIDLTKAGHQPMTNEDGSVWVVYNGEIYNAAELRPRLEGVGHVFRSRCDTEILVHGYEAWGEGLFSQLNGMFALGLWDAKRQRLVLARDRMGQKPLYFAQTTGGVAFASELKSLRQHPAVANELDPQALARYLLYEYVPAPYSILKGVEKLPPATCAFLTRHGRSQHEYWRMSFPPPDGRVKTEEAAASLRSALKKAIKRRLVSDVPLGIFLSGGLDSSSILALVRELMPEEEIKTFCIGFDEPSFDESEPARQVAEHFGAVHQTETLTFAQLISLLPQSISIMDEPFADASLLPTYLLSSLARQKVTVALAGDGGDELLAGYPTFFAGQTAARLDWLPGAAVSAPLTLLARLLPVSLNNISLDFKIKQFLRGLSYPLGLRDQAWLAAFLPEELDEVLSRAFPSRPHKDKVCSQIIRSMSDGDSPAFRDLIDAQIYFYCRYYLANDILLKTDAASMAHALEVRAPFLDVELIETINRLPGSLKLKGLTTKWLLRKAMSRDLPANILARPKKGFGIPIARWLRGPLREQMLDLLSPSRLKDQGLLNPDFVQKIVADHLTGRADNRKMLWTLFVLQSWLDLWKPAGLEEYEESIGPPKLLQIDFPGRPAPSSSHIELFSLAAQRPLEEV